MLKRDNFSYLTRRASSLADVLDVSTYCFWSPVESVQVLHDDCPEFLCRLQRILKRQSIEVQSFNFWGYLRGQLKNLRFSYEAWAGRTFGNSGFYSNRSVLVRCYRYFRMPDSTRRSSLKATGRIPGASVAALTHEC
jgi:hypothetical protein